MFLLKKYLLLLPRYFARANHKALTMLNSRSEAMSYSQPYLP